MKRFLQLAFALTILVASSASQAALPPGFLQRTIDRPDEAQWDDAAGVTFSASGRMFVWERGGRVWVVDEEHPVLDPILDISDEVGGWRDHGLLGLALHPDFDALGHIYLLYVVDRHHLMNCDSPAVGRPICSLDYNPAENQYFAATIGRLVRYTAIKPAWASDYREATQVDPDSRRVLIGETFVAAPKGGGFPVLYESHSVGTLLFGTDGTLLASMGDGASYWNPDTGSAPETYFAQALDDGILRPKENVGAYRAQLVDSLNGKILRIDPETGDGVPSNPFYDPAAPRAPRSQVWALGLRNPFRMTLRSGTGSHEPADANPGVLLIGDVGWDEWEELSVARTGGQNFGWPVFEGFKENTAYRSLSTPNQDTPNPLYGSYGCTQEFFSFTDLIQEDTLETPSWPNPCDLCDPKIQITGVANVFLHARPAIDWSHAADIARWGSFDAYGRAITLLLGEAAPDGSVVLGAPFRGSSSTGGVWYTGTDFPAQYHDTYFHGDFVGNWIQSFVFDANSHLKEVRPFLTDGWVVSLATHPTAGGLYSISWPASLLRIEAHPIESHPVQSHPMEAHR